MINFYLNKEPNLPRFFYRNYINQIKNNNITDNEAFLIFERLISSATGGDFNKFTWNLPEYFKQNLNKDLFKKIKNLVDKKRQNKSIKINKAIFPHVADEFSLSNDFLSSIFEKNNFPKIYQSDIFFSFGSCFASNFTTFLLSKKISATNYGQFEDLNSPGSNSALLNCIHLNENDLKNYISDQVNIFWSTFSVEQKKIIVKDKINEILELKKNIYSCDKIIITLGNIVDFYIKNHKKDLLAPKFISLATENIDQKTLAYKKLAKSGAYLRMSTFEETKKYINNIFESIRKISKKLDILFTVSPVPLDNVIGIHNPSNINALEMDCISKSTIRAALYELMSSDQLLQDKKNYYIPSYEIIRWIAPMIGKPVFGLEDAASRHVSNIYLNTVCEFVYFQSFSNKT